MGLVSYCLLCLVHPGPVPLWLSEELIEEFVRAVLVNVVQQGGISTQTGINNNNTVGVTVLSTNTASHHVVSEAPYHHTTAVEEEEVVQGEENANREIVEEQEQANSQNGDSRRKPNVTEVSMGTTNAITQQQQQEEEGEEELQHNSSSRRRRGRRWAFRNTPSELWMPHRNAVLIASDALAALDRSSESFEREMSFLLGGARRCQFCRVYKLAETHHCSRCGTCVYHMDHHCFWLSRCIGYGNRKYFILFIGYFAVTLCIISIHVFISTQQGRCCEFGPNSSTLYFFVVVFASFFGLALFIFFLENLFILARGDSTLRIIQEEQRQQIQSTQPFETGYAYVPGELEDDVDVYGTVAPRSLTLRNVQNVFGIGRIFPAWFLPVPPVRLPLLSQETGFWSALRVLVEQQLRSVADADGENVTGEVD
ncbi:Palmitoyltransferase [Trypanosoma melophagium]|uniref:Palmitoyltransferase n=1 Tax=Trypanosoma melophagium TaxID=715481 RepID=UPI003519E2CD|nr:Palmitoyltransferase [Trypanosoma melophagium]